MADKYGTGKCEFEKDGKCAAQNVETERRVGLRAALDNLDVRLNKIALHNLIIITILSISGVGLIGAYGFTALVWRSLSKDRIELVRQFSVVQENIGKLSVISEINAQTSMQVMNRLSDLTDKLDKVIQRQYEHEMDSQVRADVLERDTQKRADDLKEEATK